MSLEEITPDFVTDARGVACPGPILEAKRSIAKIPVGGVLEIKSSDDGTLQDLPIWAKRVGHDYLGHLESEGYYRLFIRRKK
jgi:TusA-related sulfurtransferase